MDIAFTISVWVGLVGLVVRGLRLTQRRHAETHAPTAPALLRAASG